ncbi:denticleless protein homolog [Galendromus occidentalis]|uniref:Denticleless protein homolog n=1 Tax=Galendromus occidentalis TaxID=34638 RepID=A0AAJ6QQL6_9ACAR|nr:denticleless protein homolog [Galendromus occidentalis]
MDDLRSLRRRKVGQKFNGLSYVEYQKSRGFNLGKWRPPVELLKGIDKVRIPSDMLQDSDAHPIVCRFRAHHDHILAIANEDGVIEIIDTIHNKFQPKKTMTPHPSMISDISWLSPNHLLSGTCPPHNQVGIVDVDRGQEIWSKGRLHKGSVKVVAKKATEEDVFASGGRDGDIIVYDKRVDDQVLRVHGAHPKKGDKRNKSNGSYGVTSLNFRGNHHLISTASGGGFILVWDLRRSYSLMREPRPFLKLSADIPESSGFTYATVCPERRSLYAQCSDNIIYSFDINTYADKPVSIFYGHNAGRGEGAYFIKMDVSPSGRYLAIGSPRMDELCEEQPIPIFDTKRPGPPLLMLKGHYAEPTCPSWCTDLKLASCGDDQQLILWEPVSAEDTNRIVYGYCEGFKEKPLSDKIMQMHEQYNRPKECDATPRVNKTIRCSVSLADWLKSSPGTPQSPATMRSPLTPLRMRASTPSQKRSSSQTSSAANPQTPKRKKLSTPRSKAITGFFPKERETDPSGPRTPTSH